MGHGFNHSCANVQTLPCPFTRSPPSPKERRVHRCSIQGPKACLHVRCEEPLPACYFAMDHARTHTHTHTQLTTHPTICNDVHMQVKDCVSTAWRVLSRPVSQELTPVHTHSCAPDRFCVWAWRIRNVKGRTTCILHCGHQVSAANTGGLCPPPSHIHHHQQTKRSS